MDEAPAAHEALGRVVAVEDAVDSRQVAVVARLADPRRAEAPRHRHRMGHAFGRRGMGRHHVGFRGLARVQRLAQVRGAAERDEETRGREGVVAGPRDDVDTDLVGIDLLLAREARERQLRVALEGAALVAVVDDVGRLADHGGALFELGPPRRMALRHMGDLVRHHGRDFGRVVGERQEAARHVDVAGGQREGVDDRRVEDRDAIDLGRRVARGRELRQDLVEVALGGGGPVFPTEIGHELLVLARRGAVDARGAGRRGRQRDRDLDDLGLIVDAGTAAREAERHGDQRHRAAAPRG